MSKRNDENINPSHFILSQIFDESQSPPQTITNMVELCRFVNEKQGIGPLTNEDEEKIQMYGILLWREFETNSGMVKWLNWKIIVQNASYGIGLGSILYVGFNWWIVAFMIATWWANGAAKMAAQKPEKKSWEMTAHMIIHLLALLGLLGFSVQNFFI